MSRDIIMMLLLQTRSVLQLLRHNTAIVLCLMEDHVLYVLCLALHVYCQWIGWGETRWACSTRICLYTVT